MQKTFLQTQPLANHYVRSFSLSFPHLFASSTRKILTFSIWTGQIISQMMPLLMMRHRRIPRARWRDHSTQNGKHWIEQVRFFFSSLNFSSQRWTRFSPLLIIIQLTDAGPRQSRTPSSVDDWISSRLGKLANRNGHGTRKTARSYQHRLGHQASRRRAPRRLCPAIRGITIPQGVCVCSTRFFFCYPFLSCLFHHHHHEAGWWLYYPIPFPPSGHGHPANAPIQTTQLTSLELSFLNLELGEEVVLRRLCILLALKAAYIKAIGQPIGFDWSRLEFNISEETCSGDGQPLTGWEFRLYKAHLGVQRRGILIEESYQCVTAHFRGTADSKFVWQDTNKDLESWVQFINIDQMTNVIPKLTD
jgi:hypothetical protein